ncbi:trk system potassium uptake protein TrkH [Parasporobacterium paucivorans DSM 15970]|uniref:Trk system potassium uptake protein TrkH n=2 Tax=Parasporobacterium TaxID=115543 RepID=A0A1M6IVD2_9FIRM|nr:trk system potassium uptake protein TrkH [Parasporobacterium paucivorans DSM 15970]
MSPMKIILMGYCLVILVGTLLLMLPASAKGQGGVSMIDAFFTATSATCVTGLVRFDTYMNWTIFGQIVILVMIQIGGIGFMTFVVSVISLTRMKIGFSQRLVMQESVAAPQIGGIVRNTRIMLIGTLVVEGMGALLLAFHFCPRLGLGKGLYFSVFHSISAFCNAGFDLMGNSGEAFSSLTTLGTNAYVNLIIMFLIISGGLGFFVWYDLLEKRFSFRKMELHSKMVIVVTLILVVGGAAGIFIFEQFGSAFDGYTTSEKILLSFFQSVTARTAGFNSANLGNLMGSSQFLMICLMMIGGSAGSTAGGIKTTTFAVMVMSISAKLRREKSIECFGRRLDDEILRTSSCIFMIYMFASIASAMVISTVENVPVFTALFETVSAIGTVGCTLGITPGVGTLSEIILSMLMIFGRVGPITFLFAFSSEKHMMISKMPLGKIRVG